MKKMRILFSILTVLTFQAKATVVTVDYTTTNVCEGTQTTFTSTSQVSGGATITNWNWDLDSDGQFDDAFGPSIGYQFNSPGVYNVGLQIITDMDPPVAVYKLITVNPVPNPNFSAADVCYGSSTTLNDQSTIATGSIVNWQWDFDNDGNYNDGTGSSISHNFGIAGSYVVGLLVTSNQGCTATTNQTITVDPVPSVSFSVDEVCLGNQTELTAITSVSSGQVSSYAWELNGNGLFDDASGSDITHQFVSDGNYQIGLLVTTDQGCVNDTFQLVTIAPFPAVIFTFDNACQNNAVQFQNLTSNVVGTITYAWTFGLEGTSTLEHPSFSFSGAGPAQVRLIGLTSYGCADTLIQTVQVHPSPEADFSATEVCFGQITSFTNETDPKGSTIESYFWDYGDGNVDIGANPFHQFNAADSSLVTLIAYTTDGCRDTIQHYVHVWDLPNPVISADSPLFFCEGEDVTLTVNPSGVSILWSTGEQTQSITVDTTGQYEVLITDDHGCLGQTQILVFSWLLPELTISNDTTVSLGEEVPLWVSGANFYDWTPATYLDDPTSASPISSPKESISYSVLGTDLNGCQSSISVDIRVLIDYNLKPVNLFTPNGDGDNERFYIGNIECYSDCALKVYNRWGLEVFSSNAYQNDWTGDFNEDKLPDGTYYYVIECDGREERFDGAVTILR